MVENKIDKYLKESSGLYEVKEGLEVSTGDFWYDLTDGGYLDPDKILVRPNDIREVNKAIQILMKFKESCEEQIEGFVR